MDDKEIQGVLDDNKKLRGVNANLESRVAELEDIIKPKHDMKQLDPSVCLTTSALIPNGRKCQPEDIEKFVDNVKKRCTN